MNDRLTPLVFCAVATVACPGCVVMPATTPVAPPSRGVVRDARTHQPVSGALVSAERAGYYSHFRTDHAGSYHLPELQQWHFLVYIGDPGVCPSPWWFSHSSSSPYVVTVAASGYESASRSFTPPDRRAWRIPPESIPRSLDFDVQPKPK